MMSISSKESRHFNNTLKDYSGGSVKINDSLIKQQIRNFVEDILSEHVPLTSQRRGDLYVGDAGIAYMLYYLIKNNVLPEMNDQLYQHALQYVDSSNTCAKKSRRERETAFILGGSGILAVSAVIYSLGKEHAVLSKEFISKFLSIRTKVLESDVNEVLMGRAGYLSGVFWMNKVMVNPIMSNSDIHKICDAIVASGREYSKVNNSPCPLMYSYHGSEYLGAAHGLSAILQMLLTAPDYLKNNKETYNDVKTSVDYLLTLQTRSGNFPRKLGDLDPSEEDEVVHWCHGGPGVIYLMAKAYLMFEEQKYLDSCVRTGELVWNKGLLRKGPGLCHGIAGNGYVFLLLYRLTHDYKYLHRAAMLAKFIKSAEFEAHARTPDRPYSLYEGTAGTVCFLVDLLKRDDAAFPFLDVF